MTSGEGEKHAHSTQKSPKEHIEVAEAVKEAPNEPAPEPVSAEPVMFLLYTVDVQTLTFGASQTPKPVPEMPAEVLTHDRSVTAPICLHSRTPLQAAPELTSESHVSDGEGVAISKEEREEFINKAVVSTYASFFGAIGA